MLLKMCILYRLASLNNVLLKPRLFPFYCSVEKISLPDILDEKN